MFKIPKELCLLANILPKPIYIVGGFVRDSLLNIKSTDYDLCSSLTIEELSNNLKNTDFKVLSAIILF